MTRMLSNRLRSPAAVAALAALAALAGLLGAVPAAAATFEDLYRVTVPFPAEASDPRAQAQRDAMRKLLTRMTGRRDAAGADALEPLVADAASYVDSFGRPSRDEAQVGFFADAIQSELTELGWPIWGAERPLTLVWLAVDRGNGERGVLSASIDDDGYSAAMADLLAQLEEELFAAADARGLPIALPLWDLVDINALSFAELWGGFNLQVLEASRRYGADAVLVGRVQLTEFGPRVQWTLLRDRQRRTFVSRDVASGLHWVADRFASEFASVGGARSTRLTVSNVGTMADYGRVMRFLGSVSVLDSVDVETYEDSVLTLRVAARGDANVLERTLALGEVLAPVQRSFGDSASDGALAFEVAR